MTLLVVALTAIAFAGCDRGPAMSQVRGTLLYKDGSVPGGYAVVRFQPTGESTAPIRKGATGIVGPNGAFEMYTRSPGDGIYHGEYAVTFFVVKSLDDPKPLIPNKYANPATSPYPSITVDRDITDLKLEVEPLPGAPRAKRG